MLNIPLKIIKDYPKKGVNFLDINPLLQNPAHFKAVIDFLCAKIPHNLPPKTAIISAEARGFLFAAPVAYKLGLPLLLIRKEGKIPNNPYPFRITNEYTSYNMEVDGDLLAQYDHFIFMDDILATGQTLAAVRNALQANGKEMIFSLHVTDVAALKEMRDQNKDLQNLPIETVL